MTALVVASVALLVTGGIAHSTTSAPWSAATVADTVHVSSPTGERETDRASILEALAQVRPGGTVQFAPGTYLVGPFVDVAVPRITLAGHPDGTTIRGCDPAGFTDMRVAVAQCNGLNLTGGEQTVRALAFELTWHALVLGGLTCEGGDCRPVSPPIESRTGGYVVERSTFRESQNGIRVVGEWSEAAVIRDNRFINTYHAVVVNGMTAHIVDNLISVPDPERVPYTRHPGGAIGIMGWDAPDQAAGCDHNVIAGNRITGHPDAILIMVASGGICRRNTIRGNTIESAPVRFAPPSTAVSVRIASDSTIVGDPIALVNGVFGNGTIEDNLIEGNRIVGASGLAVRVTRASRNRILDNTITGVARRDSFPGNTLFREPPEWGEANGAGIWVSAGSDENEIIGNTFEDVASHAIVLEGDRNVVETRREADRVRDLGSGNSVVSLPTDRVEAVRHLTDRFIAAWNDDSPDLVERFYARDAVLTLAGGTVLEGRYAIVDTFVRPNVARIGGMRPAGDPQVDGTRDTITLARRYRARFAPAPDTVTIRVSNRWALQSDGSWLTTASTFELPKDDVDGPIRSRFVHSDGTRLHYLDFGGDGLPLVFIPSANRTAYTYIDFAARFADRHRVLALTRRGSGQSGGEAREAVTNVARLARDVLALLDSLGIERAVVVDRWTEIPIYLAEQHAERLAGLVILRGVPPEPDPFELRAQDATRLLEMYDRAGAAMFGWDLDRSGPRKEEWYEPRFLRTGAKIEVPALSFIIESVTPRWEVEWGFRVGLADEVTSDPRSFPDSISRLFFQRLATDPQLQADVQVFYQNAFAPAWQAAERAFFDAFSDHRVVRLEGENPRNYYQYRHAPELIYSHIRNFLDAVGVRERGRSSAAAPASDTVHVALPTGDKESDLSSILADLRRGVD